MVKKNLFEKRTKCVIYIRVSSERQVEGFSLDGQKRELVEYAKAKGYEVETVYVEEGRSGKNIEGREEFQKMIYDVTRSDSAVGYVLVFKLSRFGRNTRDILNSINLLQKYGVNLLTKEEGLDSSTTMGNMLIAILGTIAEMERENIITQTMLGREEKARQGGWNGGFAPFAYDVVDERLVPNEYAYIVKMIFEKYVNENVGIKGVVDYLNKNGIKKPVPKNRQDFQFTDWSTHTIKHILDNPAYTGFVAFGRRKTVQCLNEETGEIEYKLKKQDEYISSVEQSHEAIISQEVFDMAQQKRKSRACKGNKNIGQTPKHLLSGLLKCPQCGSHMVINYNKWSNQDKTARITRSYICGHYNRAGAHGECSRNGIAAELIEKEVVEYTKKLISNPEFTIYLEQKIGKSLDVSEIEKDLEFCDKKLKQLERNKGNLERDIDNIMEDDKSADRKRKDMNRRLDKIYEDMEELEVQREGSLNKLSAVQEQQLNQEKIFQLLLNFDKIYDKLTNDEKRKLLHSLISEVEIYRKDEIKETKTYIKKVKYAFEVENVAQNLGNKGNSVETCVLLSKLKTTQHIEVKIDLDEMDLTKAESKATYAEIKQYVLDKFGLKVSQLYIAQVKRKHGIIERTNYNIGEGKARVPQVPLEKEKAIEDALKHFKMI